MDILITLLGILWFGIGAFLAWVVSGRKGKLWPGYFFFLLGLLGTVLIYHIYFGSYYSIAFLIGALFGWIFELIWGLIFHITFGQQLWYYKIHPLGKGKVTFITPPFWGFAAVLFFRILEIAGIVSIG